MIRVTSQRAGKKRQCYVWLVIIIKHHHQPNHMFTGHSLHSFMFGVAHFICHYMQWSALVCVLGDFIFFHICVLPVKPESENVNIILSIFHILHSRHLVTSWKTWASQAVSTVMKIHLKTQLFIPATLSCHFHLKLNFSSMLYAVDAFENICVMYLCGLYK